MTAPRHDTKTAGERAGGSIKSLFFGLLLVSIVSGGSGFLAGGELKRSLAMPMPSKKANASVDSKIESSPTRVLQLPDVITNLAGGGGTWVRLSLAVVIGDDRSVPPELGPQLAQDVTALVRTLTLHQISSSSGFQHLREELTDRMRLRSSGRVKELMLESMVFE